MAESMVASVISIACAGFLVPGLIRGMILPMVCCAAAVVVGALI